mmetsp:Transcript_3648/g.9837  ORF Transcript_3648/g.9837 Transcript_3648/m.9837 type:complete len:352 (-) Transcript_3648:450-1505(-)
MAAWYSMSSRAAPSWVPRSLAAVASSFSNVSRICASSPSTSNLARLATSSSSSILSMCSVCRSRWSWASCSAALAASRSWTADATCAARSLQLCSFSCTTASIFASDADAVLAAPSAEASWACSPLTCSDRAAFWLSAAASVAACFLAASSSPFRRAASARNVPNSVRALTAPASASAFSFSAFASCCLDDANRPSMRSFSRATAVRARESSAAAAAAAARSAAAAFSAAATRSSAAASLACVGSICCCSVAIWAVRLTISLRSCATSAPRWASSCSLARTSSSRDIGGGETLRLAPLLFLLPPTAAALLALSSWLLVACSWLSRAARSRAASSRAAATALACVSFCLMRL